MSTANWPAIEPNEENNSDLFGTDLFGDDIFDMYNSSDVTEIPNILLPKAGDENQLSTKAVGDIDYDGLCAIRPSNSISDFTSILENNNTMLPSPSKVIGSNVDLTPVIHPAASSSSDSGKKRVRETDSAVSKPVKKAAVNNSAAKTKGVTKVTPVTAARRVISSGDMQKSVGKVSEAAVAPAVTKSVSTAPPVSSKLVGSSNATPSSKPSNNNNAAPTQVVSKVPVSVPTKSAHKTDDDSDDEFSNSNGSYKTEECFKGVAQAAVTNLILSASNTNQKAKSNDQSFQTPIDTSSAHVAALTSNNWVAACAASICGAPPGTAQAAQAAALAAASDPAAAKAARARRATLTADERARQNRDRNREHARNTRLRKKAYVEELKRTLTELVSQRDAAELEKRLEKQRDIEVREVRYRVMEEFLKLRARGTESNLLTRWSAILEDSFTLTLPKTPYRSSVHHSPQISSIVSSDGTSTEDAVSDDSIQILHGANASFDDASKACSYLSSILNSDVLQISYFCERSNFIMDGVKAVLDWTLKATPQADGEETKPTFILKGCLRAKFSPASNKLASAELFFDTGSVKAQADDLKTFSPCPISDTNTLIDTVLPTSVSVVSADKDSSDEEGPVVKTEPQTS
jgi:hypothetical protein